jgi:LysM repeat protein
MNNLLPFFAPRHLRRAAFALLLATTAPALQAQSAPPPAPVAPTPSVIAMSQDVQELQRTVNQLSLQVEALQQDNERLKTQIPSAQDLKIMMENAIAESRNETTKAIDEANANLSKDILANVAQQMEALAKDTNVQLKKLADAIADKPVAVVPIKRTPLPPNTQVEKYTVKKGDSLAKIAQLYKVSPNDIMSVNLQIDDPNKLREGQELGIPLKDGASAPPAPTGN